MEAASSLGAMLYAYNPGKEPPMENAANSPESVTNAFVRALNRQDVEACWR